MPSLYCSSLISFDLESLCQIFAPSRVPEVARHRTLLIYFEKKQRILKRHLYSIEARCSSRQHRRFRFMKPAWHPGCCILNEFHFLNLILLQSENKLCSTDQTGFVICRSIKKGGGRLFVFCTYTESAIPQYFAGAN